MLLNITHLANVVQLASGRSHTLVDSYINTCERALSDDVCRCLHQMMVESRYQDDQCSSCFDG